MGAAVATRLTDSPAYAHLWSTPALADIFGEHRRLQTWLGILAALAAAQAEHGLIPAAAAEQIATHARADLLDLDLVAAETRRTGHSTLGLIRGLQRVLPETAREQRHVLEAFAATPDSGLSGAAATRAEVLKRLPGVAYAHFATHGRFDLFRPRPGY